MVKDERGGGGEEVCGGGFWGGGGGGGGVPGDWRKLHNEELHGLYLSSDIFWVIKSGSKRWVGHVACLGKRRDA